MNPIRALLFLPALAATLFVATAAWAGEVHRSAPGTANPGARYLIYLHGRYVEKHGADGTYRYDDILRALAQRGFEVIGRERDEGGAGRHARWVRDQVETLLKAGVPAKNITVAGHSKGGLISMLAAGMLGNGDIRYAIMAACGPAGTRFGRPYRKFIERDADRMKGRFLVAWDRADDVAADCDAAMKKAGVPFRDLTFDTGRGHRLFYQPEPVWLDAIEAFAKQE